MDARVVTVNEVLSGHVALDIECLDRVYLNAYVPILQSSGQVVAFMTQYLGLPIPSPALFDKIGQRFRRSVASFAEASGIPWVKFAKDDRKADVMAPYFRQAAADGRSRVAAIGVAQEFQRVWTAYQRDTKTRLTKPRSPTTTGKIERLHQTLQLELLSVHAPFASIEDAQAAVDAWRKDYNTRRPHQSLAMAFPAARFTTPAADAIGLRIPAELTGQPALPAAAAGPEPDDGTAASPAQDAAGDGQRRAVELDRLVPPSGNLWMAGQQIWLGPAMTGRTVRLWAGLSQVHVLLDGHRIKTLPSRLNARDLARLAAAGARPARPPPLPPASGDVTEADRTVNASGNVSLGDRIVSAGLPLAGQRVTLRLDGPVAHILAGGVLARTVACPVPPEARPRLRGARPGTAQPPRLPEPLVVARRVSARGSVMAGGQKIQVGLAHARKTVEVIVGTDTYEIAVETGVTVTAAPTTSRDIRRHKASNYD